MLRLDTPCQPGEHICNAVYDKTHNQTLADYSGLIIGKPLALIGLFVLFLVLRWAARRVIDKVVVETKDSTLTERAGLQTSARRRQRTETLGSMFKSIVTGVLVAVFGTMALSEVGVNIAPVIASAGIIGIALGFGAQSLVKDFLSGVFMIAEDQFGVGDVIDAGVATGTVEAVSLRVTRLRDINGTVWYVPNGQITSVGNQSQNWSQTVLDIGVAYGEDLAKVKRVLTEIAHDIWTDEDYEGKVIQEPSVWGVQELAADQVTVRLVLKTTPGDQWVVAREMRERIKARFDVEGIEIPFPQRVVWHRDAPDGGQGADQTSDQTGRATGSTSRPAG